MLIMLGEEKIEYSIINIYEDVLNGRVRSFPAGTWQKDDTVRTLVKHVLETKVGMSRDEIPLIKRDFIAKYKLWGALNRFKSIRRLIQFVYPGEYEEHEFHRVPAHYWRDTDRVRERFKQCLEREGLAAEKIPSFLSYDLLIQWGFSNPVKHCGHSPFRFVEMLYPGMFKETDFKKLPNHYRRDEEWLKEQFLSMLAAEQIEWRAVPVKVNREMLDRYRLGSMLSLYSNSISKFIRALYPDDFCEQDFRMSNGYWADVRHVKMAIGKLLESHAVSEEQIPSFLTKRRLQEAGLGGMLHYYKGSPIEIVETVYPERFDITEFQRVPNQHWYSKENRVRAMRRYCEKNEVAREQLPLLNRTYFRKHLPRFVSVADRHYDSKFYRWVMESFPEYTFSPKEFDLLMGDDGQVCDSKEELVLHNFLIHHLVDADVSREGLRLLNERENEVYIPDWMIKQNGRTYIVEYFGLYGSDLYKGYI